MDPNGGMNPSVPKLDNTQPAADQPVDIYSQPQSFDQPVGGASIPSEVPAGGPVMQDVPGPAVPTATPDQGMGFPNPQPPQFQDPAASYQPPIDPDPMLNQPMMETPAKPAGGGKKILVIFGGLILALLLLGGAAFAGYTMGKTAGSQQAATEFQQQQAAAQQTQNTSASTQNVTLDLSNTVQTNQVKDEELTGKIGEPISASDGFVVQVTNIERKFTTDEADYQLDDGKELVKVNFVMGNAAEDRAKTIKSSELYLEEGTDQTKVTPESRLTKYKGYFDTVTIQPGEQTTGSIVYAVTKDVAPLVFVRDQTYKFSNQNKQVTTKTSITLTD